MSHVSNILLLGECGLYDLTNVKKKYPKLHAFLEKYDFKCLSKHATGRKCMEVSVYGIALNYGDLTALKREFHDLEDPTYMTWQLLIKDQHDEKFELVEHKCDPWEDMR